MLSMLAKTIFALSHRCNHQSVQLPPLIRRFSLLKAGGKRNAPARSLAMTSNLTQVGTIPGLMDGSAYKGSPCYKKSAGL